MSLIIVPKMTHQEIVINLQATFAQRVAKYAHEPVELSLEDATNMLGVAKIGNLLHVFSKYGLWLKKKAQDGVHIDRAATISGLFSVLRKNPKGENPRTRPSQQAPVRKHHTPEQALALREAFQDTVTDGSWCITPEEAQGMLIQYDMATLVRTFSELGQTFPADQAQECLDLLNWKLTTAEI